MKLLGDRNWYLPRWLKWLLGGNAERVASARPARTTARTRTWAFAGAGAGDQVTAHRCYRVAVPCGLRLSGWTGWTGAWQLCAYTGPLVGPVNPLQTGGT